MRPAKPIAIVDIGSNSVRLVVYSGAPRVPTPIFNEKVLAGLGAELAATGELSARSQEKALAALRRYHLLIGHMGVKRTRVVATAAVRDARNGAQFVRRINAIGFNCEVLPAGEEARLAGEGVLSAIPGADGIVGDLGGGSLELADVRKGQVTTAISLRLGVLRVSADGEKKALEILRSALHESGLAEAGAGRPFYMVGGSWRALARIDMIATEYPLPVKHQYAMRPKRARELRQVINSLDATVKKALAPARLATSPVAAMILAQLTDELRPSELVLSSFGIREGLLFSKLSKAVRKHDPLIEAARDAGGAERRFGKHGDLLDDWIGPAFDDPPALARIRHASCLLTDVAWQATPDFRADRGVEMALHGNWVGVDAPGRVMMAQALSSSFGRDKLPNGALAGLCTADEIGRAQCWGHAIRLGQRLSGGVGSVLQSTSLILDPAVLHLHVREADSALVSDGVRRRLSRLAESLGRTPKILISE
ncbi:Ppx/GppA family phosphatase [Sphingomonas sp.]|uniref:Ppx/GppA family phosphatase n=1 Tax=Sphingomonas sp. TaxID=28214 RepID=UPI00286C8E16|nr:Ppx/GppA family phosphatase [Sphingomonas sp.]